MAELTDKGVVVVEYDGSKAGGTLKPNVSSTPCDSTDDEVEPKLRNSAKSMAPSSVDAPVVECVESCDERGSGWLCMYRGREEEDDEGESTEGAW